MICGRNLAPINIKLNRPKFFLPPYPSSITVTIHYLLNITSFIFRNVHFTHILICKLHTNFTYRTSSP